MGDLVRPSSAAPHPVEAGDARPLQRVRRGSNAVFAVGPDAVLKLFRRIESGPDPEIEMRSHLARVGFARTPTLFAGIRCALSDAQQVWLDAYTRNLRVRGIRLRDRGDCAYFVDQDKNERIA